MNATQASKRGLQYTGYYNQHKDEITKIKEEIRKQGYKAIIVAIPGSKTSRSGYSIYAERSYSINKEIKSINQILIDTQLRLKKLKDEYDKKIMDENLSNQDYQNRLDQLLKEELQ